MAAAVDRVTTWADGFGVWHAVVSVGPDEADRALAAIRGELTSRGEPVDRVAVTRVGYASGSLATRVEYTEADPHTPCDRVGVDCTVPTHDHTTLPDDGRAGSDPVPMLCNGCGVPCHYAEEVEDYVHDSAAVPGCPLALIPGVAR